MADQAVRAHQNLVDFTRLTARLQPAAALVDTDDIVASIGPTDSPAARTAIRTDSSAPAAAIADHIEAAFSRHGATGVVFARVGADDDLTEVLTARGLREWAQTPEMICEGALPSLEPPTGVTVRLASTPADVAAYAEIAGRAFTHLAIDADITRTTIDNAEIMLGDDCVIALADLDGTPVAGALVVLFDGGRIGYVAWVACLDEARGRGLGDVVTRRVTNEAFARGADLVTLEASQFGEHTYARMGYREIYRYRILIRL